MEDFVFFVKNKNEEENLLLHHCNKLMEISRLLFEIFRNNDYFMDYLVITNSEGVVESFTSNEIIVNYEDIMGYIKKNIRDVEDLKKFFLELIRQSDIISGNDVMNNCDFRKNFSYLFN